MRTTLVLVLALPFATMTGMTLWITDFTAVGGELADARWSFILLATGVFFLQYPLLALRWRMLLDVPDGPRPPMREMTGLMLVAHVFDLVIPGPAGDLAVSYLLKIRRGLTMANATAAGAYGRIFGLISLATLPMVLAPLLFDELPSMVERTLDGGMVVALIAGSSMLALAIHPRGWAWLVRSLARVMPVRWRESDTRTGRGVRGMMAYLSGLAIHSHRIAATPARMIGAALLSLAVIGINVLCLHLMLLGLHTSLPLAWVTFAFCAQMVANVAGFGIPGGGNITAPVVCLAVFHGLMGIGEERVVSVLFLSWTPNILACAAGLVISLPNLDHIAHSLKIGADVHDDSPPVQTEEGPGSATPPDAPR
ncbi:MAG: lysylphosphatidylglycerol synthase transmembrane domain-containing protein [Myxococcota bacterium]|nr:lysylphosphatidylglycerol synthase transmembrane domain-containing protein [Myxococcota bacterium]